jgi:hypothetical protein
MIEPDMRVDHLIAAAIAKWGAAAVLEQVVKHVTMQSRYMPAIYMAEYHDTCRDLWGVFAQVRMWENKEMAGEE